MRYCVPVSTILNESLCKSVKIIETIDYMQGVDENIFMNTSYKDNPIHPRSNLWICQRKKSAADKLQEVCRASSRLEI